MAYKPIIGHDGATPALNFAGTKPVVMESPCPYAQWDAEVTLNDYGTLTGSGGWWRIDSVNYNGFITGEAVIKIKMLSTKPAEILRVTLTTGGDAGTHGVSVTPYVGLASQGETVLAAGGTVTADIAVPYYRYSVRLHLTIQQIAIPPAAAAWVRADFALV